jgi:large conductance mechanosensitive channel
MAKESGMVKEFREFIARGNVIDLAVGVVIGASFNKIVTSVVEGVLMPPIGLLTGRIDFSSLFVALTRAGERPASLAEAKARGVPVIAYGQLINDVISFLVVAFVIFLVVKKVNRLWSKQQGAATDEPTTKPCPFCFSTIALKATRCPQCTSRLRAAEPS